MSEGDAAPEREEMDWVRYGVAVRELATMVADDGYRPDLILAIARGGLFVAGSLGYALAVKNLYVMNVEYYTGVDERLDLPVILPPYVDWVDLDHALGVGLRLHVEHRERLDDDLRGRGVPSQAHRPDAELLLHRLVERLVVGQAVRSARRDAERVAVLGHQLVEHLVEPVGEHRRLLLLDRHAHELTTGPRLQVERACAG